MTDKSCKRIIIRVVDNNFTLRVYSFLQFFQEINDDLFQNRNNEDFQNIQKSVFELLIMNPIQAKIEKNQAKSKRNKQLLSHFKNKRMKMKSSVPEKKACFTAVGIVDANEHRYDSLIMIIFPLLSVEFIQNGYCISGKLFYCNTIRLSKSKTLLLRPLLEVKIMDLRD